MRGGRGVFSRFVKHTPTPLSRVESHSPPLLSNTQSFKPIAMEKITINSKSEFSCRVSIQRQCYYKFSKFTFFAIHSNTPAMPFHYNIIT